MYKYSLDSKEKFTCPECGAYNRFVKFVDNKTGIYLDGDFGKCDRIDSCGYELRPDNCYINDSECSTKHKVRSLYDSDDINDHIESLRNFNKPEMKANIFFMELIKLFGIDKAYEAIEKYQLETFWDGAVFYPYFFDDNLKSAKVMWYDENLHRLKYNREEKDYKVRDNNYRKQFKWLHKFNYHSDDGDHYRSNTDDDFDFCVGLFGWDLLKGNDKTICCVEAEKTAVIMSIVYPEFIWVATGGLLNLQPHKFPYYNYRKWLFFADLGKYEDETIKKYWMKQVDKISENYSFTVCDFINYKPPKISNHEFKRCIDKGYDIADFVLDYMKYEKVKDLPMDDNLKTKFIKHLNEPIFKDCNYIEYMNEILSKYV